LFKESSTSGTTLDITAERTNFDNAMDDDLNTPLAITVLLRLATAINTHTATTSLANADEVRTFFTKALTALGIHTEAHADPIPDDILAIAAARDAARAAKDFTTSDALRDDLLAKGYTVTDSADGTKVSKK